MKVVQINCSASGSTGNIAKAIHRQLLQQGDESYIFYGFGSETEKNMFRIGNNFDLHLHAVLSRSLGRQGYFSHFPTRKLIRQLKQISPDIVHLHNLHGSYLNLSMLFNYLKKSKVRVVITLHDCWLFTGKCPHFTVANCTRWKQNCGKCTQLSLYPRSKVDTTSKCLQDKKKWLSGFEDRMRIVAVSNWLRDTARESFLNQYSIETIYNGIDTEIFKPMDGTAVRKKYGIRDKYMILGVSSNWNEQKGLGEFLELSKVLRDNEVIVLVGMRPEQIAGLPANIIGITRTENQQELAQLYSAANVFANPSREETFGLVTAEAMACGTPVIVYNSTACAEIVGEQQGIVLQPGNKNQLRTAVDTVRNQGIAADKRYSISGMVTSYLDLYRGIHNEDEKHNR